MPNPTVLRAQALLRRVTTSSLFQQWVDRRVVLGILLGGSVMATGYAVSSDNLLVNFFQPVKSDAITQQASAIDAKLAKDREDCAKGQPGTMGAAIKNAVKVHTEIASAGPAVEELFNIDDSCFSGLSQIFDLSPTIPSLGSIIGAAQGAVMKFAQKKICSAVNKVTGMVTAPLNQAIGHINTLEGYQDLNGFTQDAIGGGLDTLDPDLGKAYAGTAPKGDTYQINPNAFSDVQTAFTDGSTAQTSLTSKAPVTFTTQRERDQAIAKAQNDLRNAIRRDEDPRTYIDRLSDIFN